MFIWTGQPLAPLVLTQVANCMSKTVALCDTCRAAQPCNKPASSAGTLQQTPPNSKSEEFQSPRVVTAVTPSRRAARE